MANGNLTDWQKMERQWLYPKGAKIMPKFTGERRPTPFLERGIEEAQKARSSFGVGPIPVPEVKKIKKTRPGHGAAQSMAEIAVTPEESAASFGVLGSLFGPLDVSSGEDQAPEVIKEIETKTEVEPEDTIILDPGAGTTEKLIPDDTASVTGGGDVTSGTEREAAADGTIQFNINDWPALADMDKPTLSDSPARAGFAESWTGDVFGIDFNNYPENKAEASIVKDWILANRPAVTWGEEGTQLISGGNIIEPGVTTLTADIARFLGLEFTGDEARLISQQEFDALHRNLRALDFADLSATQVIEAAFTQDANSFARWESGMYDSTLSAIDSAHQESLLAIKAQYDAANREAQEKVAGIETRKTTLLQGQQARATIDYEFNLRQGELEDQHQRLLETVKVEHQNLTDQLTQRIDAEAELMNRKYELEIDIKYAQNEFDAEQNRLDRALAIGNLEEVSIHNRNLEILKAQENILKRDELKVALVSKVADNPAFLYYAKKSGMLDILADALGGKSGADDMYKALTQFIPEDDMKFGNIQTMNKQSAVKQAIIRFGESARSGLNRLQLEDKIRREAPRDVRQPHVRPEIRAGRGVEPGLYDFATEEELERAVVSDTGRFPEEPDVSGTIPLRRRGWEQPEGGETWRQRFLEDTKGQEDTEEEGDTSEQPISSDTPPWEFRENVPSIHRTAMIPQSFNWDTRLSTTRLGEVTGNPAENAINDITQTFIKIGYNEAQADQITRSIAATAQANLSQLGIGSGANIGGPNSIASMMRGRAKSIIKSKGYADNPAEQKRFNLRIG